MFCLDPPIDIVRIFSLNKARKSRKLLDLARSRETTRRVRVRLCSVKINCYASTADSASGVGGVLKTGVTGSQGARMERLAALKTAIAQGRYHVSAADLAEKLIDHMLACQARKNPPPKNRPPDH
jgi:anti-sigma28 factor (negative regulator of flagellin synthesis)